jgi:hypothetical protein
VSDFEDPTVEPSFDDPSFDDPSFDDPAHDDLRALLAEAKATDPIPADVAARLDAALESLQTTRAIERDGRTNVVPLRHRVGRVLVAAAAVVVVGAGGVGIVQGALSNGGSSDKMSSDSAGSATDSDAGSAGLPSAPEVNAETPGSVAATKGAPAQLADVPAFTTARFAEQAAQLDTATLDFAQDESTDQAYGSATRSPALTSSPTPLTGSFATLCSTPALPDTESIQITLDGHRAVLVLHPVTDGTQLIEAWSCDGKSALASTTVTR